jgi:hypothetical protein
VMARCVACREITPLQAVPAALGDRRVGACRSVRNRSFALSFALARGLRSRHMGSLHDELHVGRVSADELATTLGRFFGMSRWESGRVVDYLEGGDTALRVVYEKRGYGIHDVERGPSLTDGRLSELQARIEETLLADHGTVVCRDFLFSGLRVAGYWRHADQWQMLPAPDGAPQRDTELGPHPFVIEFLVRESSDRGIRHVRKERRLWELHVLLALLLQAGVHRIGPRAGQMWAYSFEDTSVHYVQEGYSAPGFVAVQADFTDPGSLDRMTEVPEDEYFGRRGISVEDSPLQVPASLGEVATRLDAASEEVRDGFLLSAYWRERFQVTWDLSTSLSYIAVINALEVLLPETEVDRCPTCGLNRAPGPTRKLKNLLDTYAPEIEFNDRAKLYRLRSGLVHGGSLMGHDLPRGFGALVPRTQEEMDTFSAALRFSRLAAVRWLRAHT